MAEYTIDKFTYGGNTYKLKDKVSAASSITATDIANWNDKVSDDKTWNGVVLDKSGDSGSSSDYYTIYAAGTGPSTAKFITVTSTPSAYKVAKYGQGAYLYSTTPSANDNSTKAATTAYVDRAVGGITVPTNVSAFTNDAGYIAEDSNGDVTITRDIILGGNVAADGDLLCVGSVSAAGILDGTDAILIHTSGGTVNAIVSAQDLTSDWSYYLPSNNGTLALLEDIPSIPTIPSITLNGSASTSPSFYAPTSAGTSGYYLKSNGSGAPTWAAISAGTDTKVTQDYSTANDYYPILATATSGTTSTSSRGATTAILNNEIYMIPNTGMLCTSKLSSSYTNSDITYTIGNNIWSNFDYDEYSIVGSLGLNAYRDGDTVDETGFSIQPCLASLYYYNIDESIVNEISVFDTNILLHVSDGTIFLQGPTTISDLQTLGTYTQVGGVKPWFSTTGASTLASGSASSYSNSPSINARTTTAGKYYAVEVDKNGRMFVNVPWSQGTIPSITLNGSSTTSPSFYAPTSAGTSGYYLKSSGSGAPTWASFPTIPVVPSNIVNTITTTAGAHSAITSQKGDVSFNVPTTAAHVGAVADCTLQIYNGQGGNPGVVKFCTVDYSSCGSENGVLVKITMMAGHGNGSSYNHYQDAIISVNYQGAVSVNIYRYYAQSVTYSGAAHYYGDILYTIDTTNKIVKFYDLMGQYSYMKQSPFKRMNGSSGGTITQHTSASYDLSGTGTFANVFWLDGSTAVPTSRTINGKALSSNVTLKTSDLTNDSGYITSYTETDPVFSASAAAGISTSDITNWNNKSNFSGNYNDLTNKPTIPSITLNGSSTTSPSFYAPTSAGTSGYYLKSNGSGAPSWTSFPTIPSITLNGSSTTSPSFYAPTGAGTSGYFLKSNGSGAPSWTNIVDYVTTKGTSGNWKYEKWASGKIEAWGSKDTGTLTMSASGSLYRATGISITIPSSIFTKGEPTHVELFANYNNAVFVSAICAITSATELTAQVYKATNATAAVTLKIHAVYYPSSY